MKGLIRRKAYYSSDHSTKMSGHGAHLAPILVPMASCFINLPRNFVHTFLLNGSMDQSSGASIIELSWVTNDGYVQKVCVGWAGGFTRDAGENDIFEISAEFAKCIGLYDHLQEIPQKYVGALLLDSLPIAKEVTVEPCTPDDWELIQLHAGFIENDLLRQICVVNHQQKIPIWIQQNAVVRIQVTISGGIEHARISANTEIIVAPKERKNPQKNTSIYFYEASPPLLVQGIPQSISAPEDDEILVHPSTLASIEGIFSSDNGQPLNECIVSLWRFKRNISGKRSMKNEQSISKHKSRVRVCHLKCSIDILPNCAVLTENVRKYLDVPLMGRIQLRVLGVPPSLPESFEVHVDKALIPDEVRDTFLKWSSSLESARLIHSNSTLRLTLPSGAVVTATIIPQYLNTTESGEESLFDDAPIGAIEKYAYLGGKTGITLSNSNVKVIRSKSITRHKVCNSSNLGRAKIHSISYMKNVHEKICMNYKCLLVGEYAAYRILIGARPPGSVVLHGSKGCGKTNVLKAFLDEYQSNPMSMCFGIFVDCRDLRGLKMESVKSRLTDIFEQAALNAPSLIALDNLDALAPEENEGGGPANEQSCRLAEHLLHLMQQNQKKMWKNTQELQASVKEWRISFKKTSHSSDSSSEVSSTFASALQASALSKSVGVICSSRSNSSFHKSLRRCGLFDRPINIPSPDSEQRENLIRSILETKTREIDKSLSKTFLFDSSLDFTHLSSLMEGYCLRDLGNVVDRALHKSIVDSSKKGSTEIRIIHEHFSAGLDSFQPSALVGVDLFKSSVLWSDIGGLHQVRTILKDTLELPTRYGKLYENSPIKLPSGMMLYGPPGCGKTLLASAVANECGLKLISVKGPEVLNKYIGASEQAIRDLFARAAAAAPSVLFLDEFDSIAPRRGADNTGVTDRLVNQLLTFLDGVESRGGVYVLAATSRPDMIDPALLRPGRLDKSLYCGFPDEAERLDILQVIGKKMDLSEEALNFLPVMASSSKSMYFSGADLQAIMYSAQLAVVHENLDGNNVTSRIEQRHLAKAFQDAKPSTSQNARLEFEQIFGKFSKSRNTDFAIASADVNAIAEDFKKKTGRKLRTALA